MKVDPIEQLCIAISHLHSAVEEIARHVKVDVSHLLEASDCLTAQVLSDRYPPTLSPLSARSARLASNEVARRHRTLFIIVGSDGTKAQPESARLIHQGEKPCE